MAATSTTSFQFEAESTLTDRYQTTVPEPVRRMLRLGKRDRIAYRFKEGEVVLSRAHSAADDEGDDPVVGQFLSLLAADMTKDLRSIDLQLIARARALVAGVELDLDAPLPHEDQ